MASGKAPARAGSVASDGPSTLDATQATPPFFNVTFSTHRVSPLYVGPRGLTTSRLELLARRLRDTLVRDVVRGIQLGLESVETPTGQVGPLRTVKIRRLRPQAVLRGTPSMDSEEVEACIWIEICHENAAYAVLLLPSLADSADGHHPSRATKLTNPKSQTQPDEKEFINLPLLLLRMPQGLKTVIGEWLSSTFDCRVSKLTLGTKTLISVWEGWIGSAGIPGKGSDFVMTLAFNAPVRATGGSAHANSDPEVGIDTAAEPGLRTLEIAISASDLSHFLRAGHADGSRPRAVVAAWERDLRERRRLAGGNADDGWAWRYNEEQPKHPFTEALARYVDHHLAMNIFHPSVRVVQISCDAFVLAQSRLKVVKVGDITPDLARAAWMFLTQLGTRVCDNGISYMGM